MDQHCEDISDVMEILKLSDVPIHWRDSWSVSQSTYPSDGIWFLHDKYVLEVQAALQLPEDVLQAILCAASMIRNNAYLSRLAWHYQRELFANPDKVNPWTVYIPNLEAHMGNDAGLFLLVVIFSGFRTCVNMYQTKGISSDIMTETFRDVMVTLNHYKEKSGHWGMEHLWLFYHFSGRLFRLGRLQFAIDTFDGDILVYRNRSSSQTIAIAEPGIQYRSDGQVNGTSNRYDSQSPWVSTFQEDDNTISGNPVTPHGAAIPTTVTLPKSEWDLVLSKGDEVLAIHIPEGSKLHPDACLQSFQNAEEFFQTFFSDVYVKAYTCNTWLFDPQFQSLLPDSSNIVRFQREFYLYPTLNNGKSFIKEVFSQEDQWDPARAPRDTSLRRAILDHIESGGVMRSAGGFILRDDLNWGSQVYQSAHSNNQRPK